MTTSLYDTSRWKQLRADALEREAECALGRLIGGCVGPLEVHHVDPVEEGGDLYPDVEGLAVLCKRHHRMLHGLRRRQSDWKTCPHQHRTREARDLCERRLNGIAA